jgi:hypothetical protein
MGDIGGVVMCAGCISTSADVAGALSSYGIGARVVG